MNAIDLEQRFLDRGLDTIAKNLDREVAKNKITASDKASTLGRITPVIERSKLADCDLVLEAATEKFDIKAEIFRDLDRIMKPEVILASNTSSIPRWPRRRPSSKSSAPRSTCST